VWAVVIGHILRVASFLRLEWLAHSPVCAELGLQGPFGDDAPAHCTACMQPETPRAALAAALHQAKRHKAFENSRYIGLAVDIKNRARCAIRSRTPKGRRMGISIILCWSAWWARAA
jgi:hypothetical protein